MNNTMTDTITDAQFNEYLASLNLGKSLGELSATLDTLGQIQLAHLTKYPFQSLSTLLGEPIELEYDTVFEKLVHQQKGGYCYELNGLLAPVLSRLGFGVETLAGYIVHDNEPATPKARTHVLLKVRTEGQDYLVDVGFGGLVPTTPLALVPDVIQDTPHGRYRLTPFGNVVENLPTTWILSAEVKGEWQMLYAFEFTPQNQADLMVGNWFVSTHPSSPFRQRLMASRICPDGVRHSLLNHRYRRHEVGKPSQSQDIGSIDELMTLLQDTFLMNVSAFDTPQNREKLAEFWSSAKHS